MAKRLRFFLTEKMYNILATLANRRMLEQSIIIRSKIILLAYQRLQNSQIAERLGLERHCVGRWRKRWQDSVDALLAIEINEPPAVLRKTIIDVLCDAHRSGSPGKFIADQIAQVILVGSQKPRDFDRPVDDWTGRELADELKKQNIVKSISVSRVNVFLRLVNLKPQHRKGWCFTTEKDKEFFQQQVKNICQTYLRASTAYQENGTRTVCVDEMTSLQANERRALPKLPKPDQIGKMECQYTRHGTLSLTGSWDIVLGQMISNSINETRNAEDFAQHISETIATDPDAAWVFVMDNLNTHYGEPVVRLVAKQLGIDEAELGDKKKRKGILGSVASRREFLSDRSHRIRFAFTPKHSSWLNQIEIIFGVIAKRVMRHGDFTSKDDLKEKLSSFIEYFNQTYAKPVNWTYDGTQKKANRTERPRTWREKTQDRKIEKVLALVA